MQAMDQVDEIREKIDLVDLISSFVPLKKMGANFKANCPFHSEKTPSFVVSPIRQIWHCFGCDKGGDAFGFIMEYERCEFVEALRILAQKTGVKLTKFFDTGSQKEKIYNLNQISAKFYNFVLTEHVVGKRGLEYLLKRDITAKIIKTFSLGFAPASGVALLNFLKKKKFSNNDLFEAGLITQTRNGIKDFFTNRLIFPLVDHRNNIVGFSGRVMDPNIKISKYINSRETLVYHKSNAFFGLNITKEGIKKEKKVIVMEGEFDVITSFQNGIDNAVAIKGTALTLDQAKLLTRFTNNVVLCLDEDKAGIEAMKRSIPILEKTGLNVTIAQNLSGKDPDEALRTDSLAFKKAIKSDISLYDALITWTLQKNDPQTLNGKKNISEEILPILTGINNEIIKNHYFKKLSAILDISLEVLERESQRLLKKEIVGKEEVLISDNLKKTRQSILEEYLTAIIIQNENPKKAIDFINKLSLEFDWEKPALKKIILFIKNGENSSNFSKSDLFQKIPQELKSAFDVCFLLPIPEMSQEKMIAEIKKASLDLAIIYIKNKIKEKTKQLKLAENEEKIAEITTKTQELKSLAEKLSLVSN